MFLQSTRLCLIACRYLVEGYRENKKITAPQIAERFGMNVRMLNPAFKSLVRRGILRSQVGGKEPGYLLTKDPSKIFLYDILYALEGEIKMQCCKELLGGNICRVQQKDSCSIYKTVNNSILKLKEELLNISLQQYYEDGNVGCSQSQI